MKEKHLSKQKRVSKQKQVSLYLETLLFVVLMAVPSCSSLPSGIGITNPAESGVLPIETITDGEAQLVEPLSLAEAVETVGEEGDGEAADEAVETVTEDDLADIQRRAEEDLAYLDTPVNPNLPEPVYLFPEDEAAIADTEMVAEPEEPAVLAGDDDPQTEIAGGTVDGTVDGTIAGEGDASVPAEIIPAETIVVEEPPPPPALLLPPREVAAVPPPRPRPSALPVSLPQQPARVPASETGRGEKDAPITKTIQAALGETAEVPLPGSGWVYLGESSEQKGLSYQRRRLSADGQVFVFRPETAGSYRLNFKQQDLLRGTDTNAVIEVRVVEKAAAVPATVAATERALSKEAAAPVPAVDTDFVSQESGLPPETAIAIEGENPVVIAAVIDDTALWNRGRELEAPGAVRDMKGALAAYKTLVRDYPQSEYYAGSQKRIAYIERFFVNIR